MVTSTFDADHHQVDGQVRVVRIVRLGPGVAAAAAAVDVKAGCVFGREVAGAFFLLVCVRMVLCVRCVCVLCVCCVCVCALRVCQRRNGGCGGGRRSRRKMGRRKRRRRRRRRRRKEG